MKLIPLGLGRKSTGKSGVRGVSWNKQNQKWTAQYVAEIDGVKKSRHIGYFKTVAEAATAVEK